MPLYIVIVYLLQRSDVIFSYLLNLHAGSEELRGVRFPIPDCSEDMKISLASLLSFYWTLILLWGIKNSERCSLKPQKHRVCEPRNQTIYILYAYL